MCFVCRFAICSCGLLCLCLCDRRSAEQQCIGIGSGDRLCGCNMICGIFAFYIGMTYYMIYGFCVAFCELLMWPLVAVCVNVGKR